MNFVRYFRDETVADNGVEGFTSTLEHIRDNKKRKRFRNGKFVESENEHANPLLQLKQLWKSNEKQSEKNWWVD